MKNKKYHTVGTISKSNIKIVERGKIAGTIGLETDTDSYTDNEHFFIV
jgi:hypothetical protein